MSKSYPVFQLFSFDKTYTLPNVFCYLLYYQNIFLILKIILYDCIFSRYDDKITNYWNDVFCVCDLENISINNSVRRYSLLLFYCAISGRKCGMSHFWNNVHM